MGGFLNDIYEKVNNTSLLGLDMVIEEKDFVFNEKENRREMNDRCKVHQGEDYCISLNEKAFKEIMITKLEQKVYFKNWMLDLKENFKPIDLSLR